jgi:hypothetical protein
MCCVLGKKIQPTKKFPYPGLDCPIPNYHAVNKLASYPTKKGVWTSADTLKYLYLTLFLLSARTKYHGGSQKRSCKTIRFIRLLYVFVYVCVPASPSLTIHALYRHVVVSFSASPMDLCVCVCVCVSLSLSLSLSLS